MSALWARKALSFHQIGNSRLEIVSTMDLDTVQVDEYLGPLSDILDAVRNGPSHSLIGIQADGRMVGFYVVHPDRRDATCWWLGWFILARSHQGLGLGRAILARIMAGLAAVPACRRIRLIVVPGNDGAISLYGKVGFQAVGKLPGTGDIVMECQLRPKYPVVARARVAAGCPIASRRGRTRMRLRPRTGPHAARAIGVERGPPARVIVRARAEVP
jgi:GNAT superfamily N-acetyltransferase